MQLAFSALLPAGIALFHGSLQQVIMVQLLLMLGLLLAVSLPFIPEIASEETDAFFAGALPAFSKVRRVYESEVIAEFLRAEFYQPEFDRYREEFGKVVADADLVDERENAIRKALLFRRRGRLWRELPDDTQWLVTPAADTHPAPSSPSRRRARATRTRGRAASYPRSRAGSRTLRARPRTASMRCAGRARARRGRSS